MNPLTLTKPTKPKLLSLPIDHDTDTLPISVLINPNHTHTPLTRPQVLFCYQALLNTIDSLLSHTYTDFDGHTTSNCCHGMALLSWHLIQMSLELDLHTLRAQYEQAIHHLNQHPTLAPCTDHAPKALTNLACLYILCFTRESDPVKGGRTVTKKLKALAPISVNVCNQISHEQKKFFANWIALSYSTYLESLNDDLHVSGAPATLWGKYVEPSFVRSDKRGVKYASNLYSMQVTLAYLSQSRAKVALINDIQNTTSNSVTERYTCLFEGDGQGGFSPISGHKLLSLQASAKDEPVIILGGCVYSDKMNKDSLSLKMQPWLDKLPQLILACDVFYPQFCNIVDDPEFNSDSITPDELALQQLMHSHAQTKGVSTKDPSFYCLTHLYSCSLHQFGSTHTPYPSSKLPLSFIPNDLKLSLTV